MTRVISMCYILFYWKKKKIYTAVELKKRLLTQVYIFLKQNFMIQKQSLMYINKFLNRVQITKIVRLLTSKLL